MTYADRNTEKDGEDAQEGLNGAGWRPPELGLSRCEWIIWLAVSAGTTLVTMLLPNAYWYGPFGAAFVAINLVATILVTGVPFSLSAALLLTTSNAPGGVNNQSPSTQQAPSLRRRFAAQLVLTSLYMALFTLVAFGIAITQFPDVEPAAVLAYLPAALFPIPVFSLLLCSLTALIAVILDEWRWAAVGGSVFLSTFAMATGLTPWMVSYNELVLYSPYHLYRFTAIALSGHRFLDRGNMEMLIGIAFDPVYLLPPILTLVGLSLLLLPLTRSLFRRNVRLWRLGQTGWMDAGRTKPAKRQVDDAARLQLLDTAHASLRFRRRVFAAILVAFIVVFPPFYQLTEVSWQEEDITVLYDTGPSGVEIAVGEWLYGEVDVPEPPAGQETLWGITTEILDWGGCPLPLHERGHLLPLHADEFAAMNETERLNVTPGYSLKDSKEYPKSYFGWSSLFESGVHVWVVRFENPSSNSTQCHLRVTITVSIQTKDI